MYYNSKSSDYPRGDTQVAPTIVRFSTNADQACLTEGVSSRVLGDRESAVGRGLPHVLVIVVILRDHL